MLGKCKIVVVMPAYNAERTLHQTYNELPHDIVDHVVLVDDASQDNTAAVARSLGLEVIIHPQNRGYGGNQKTCYTRALELGADIVIMLHPDYQYEPRLVRALAATIADGVYDVALGSRILGGGALKGGMPLYKYISNRFLTLAQNILIGQKLSEYHTGFRAFSREVLTSLRLDLNSNDFLFDNQMLVQAHAVGFRIAEVTCPTKYFAEASSINFRRSVIYGLGCLWTSLHYRLHKAGILRSEAFIRRSGLEAPENPAIHKDRKAS
jgi:glycosyltransferase involved in cell wall biosynthesis